MRGFGPSNVFHYFSTVHPKPNDLFSGSVDVTNHHISQKTKCLEIAVGQISKKSCSPDQNHSSATDVFVIFNRPNFSLHVVRTN